MIAVLWEVFAVVWSIMLVVVVVSAGGINVKLTV